MYPFYSNQNYPFPVYSSFPQQNSPRLVCRQVGSIDEARNAMIDPTSLYLFPDFSSGKIYVKRMGDDGRSEFYSYTQEIEQKPIDPMDEIRHRLTNIENKLGGTHEPIPVLKEPTTGADAGADAKDATV